MVGNDQDQESNVPVAQTEQVEAAKESGTEERIQDDRKYACTWEGCAKRFKQLGHLKDHIKAVHEKVKPHKCPVVQCDYRCTQRSNIKKHVLTHHKELWVSLVKGELM